MGSTVGGVPALCLERGSSVDVWCQAPSQWRVGPWSVAFSAGSFTQEASSPSGPPLSQNAWAAASDTRSPTLRVCLTSHPLHAGGVGTSWRLWGTQT